MCISSLNLLKLMTNKPGLALQVGRSYARSKVPQHDISAYHLVSQGSPGNRVHSNRSCIMKNDSTAPVNISTTIQRVGSKTHFINLVVKQRRGAVCDIVVLKCGNERRAPSGGLCFAETSPRMWSTLSWTCSAQAWLRPLQAAGSASQRDEGCYGCISFSRALPQLAQCNARSLFFSLWTALSARGLALYGVSICCIIALSHLEC